MAERFTKPGTANVSPADRKKLSGLIRHYMSKPHPFTSCYRDQIKHGLSKDHAARRCAVLKDLGTGSTNWRKGAKNLSVAELREVIDMADASGLDCPSLKRARAVLAAAEERERIDMAKGDPPEDSPAFNWRKHGNRRRGVILKNGKRAIVSPAQFDKLKAGGLIDAKKTPTLKGDKPDDTVTKSKQPTAKAASKAATPAAKALKTSAPLVKHRITRGPRKGEVVEGKMVNGRFWEIRTNTDAKNPRKGQKFVALKRKDGKKVHRYVIGGKVQDIVVK